jgi:hypothetical protein
VTAEISAEPRHAVAPEQRGRLATAGDELGTPEGLEPVLGPEPILTWAADSSLMPTVGTRPRMRNMLGVCAWAALLGLVGLAVAFRGFVASLLHQTPGWYEPTMGGVGALGIALTAAAFVSVHRKHTPYILLAAATIVLGYAIFLTSASI